MLGGSIGPLPQSSLEILWVQRSRIRQFHVLRMPHLHRCQAPMAGQHWWGIGGTGWDDEGYNDVPELNGSYFVYVCVRDPERDREVETRKEEKRRRNKRMGTVPLLEISRHRESEIGVGGGFLTVALGWVYAPSWTFLTLNPQVRRAAGGGNRSVGDAKAECLFHNHRIIQIFCTKIGTNT